MITMVAEDKTRGTAQISVSLISSRIGVMARKVEYLSEGIGFGVSKWDWRYPKIFIINMSGRR